MYRKNKLSINADIDASLLDENGPLQQPTKVAIHFYQETWNELYSVNGYLIFAKECSENDKDEDQSKKKKKRSLLSKNKWRIVLYCILLSLLGLYFLIVVDNFLWSTENYYVKNTIEYQVTELKQIHNRSESVQNWMAIINEHSKYLKLQSGEEFIRSEFSINIGNCDFPDKDALFRVREVLFGDNKGKSTFDIKSNAYFQFSAARLPYWPAFHYLHASSQKCEKDVHECDSKYSRESRIALSSPPELRTCGDLFQYFPFTGVGKSAFAQPVLPKVKSFWWIYSIKGEVETSSYEISFTLKYPDEESALRGTVPPIDGEWSVRISTSNYGYSSSWDDEFKEDIETVYWKLASAIGTYSSCNIFW